METFRERMCRLQMERAELEVKARDLLKEMKRKDAEIEALQRQMDRITKLKIKYKLKDVH